MFSFSFFWFSFGFIVFISLTPGPRFHQHPLRKAPAADIPNLPLFSRKGVEQVVDFVQLLRLCQDFG